MFDARLASHDIGVNFKFNQITDAFDVLTEMSDT